MVTTDVEHELQLQLREAGRQLFKPPDSLDNLLHLLDQTEKLLAMVDQSPNSLMQEAVDQPTKALFNESLLKHSSMDVRASVASCLCEITRITAPDAPYGDEEMKEVFQLAVSSLEDLSDESSRSYPKRVSIVENIDKVKSCLIMLDLECDDLIVEMFEHFMKSVRDHHLNNIYLPIVNIMALVLEESEEISVDMIKPILATLKLSTEGVLPVALKLGEEVLKKSADKLRPELKRIVTALGGSLDNYSKVLTSICEGTTDIVEHNDESATVQPKVDETKLTPLSDSTAQVMSNGKTVSGDEGGSHNKQSKKPEEAVNRPDSNLTSEADTHDLVAEISGKSESTQDLAARKPPEPSDSSQLGENKTEKTVDIPVSAKPAIESEIANAGSLSQSKSGITKGKRSKTQKPARPQIVIGLSKVPNLTSDSDLKSPKRARKSTAKVEENKPSSQSLKKDSAAKKSKPSSKKANAGKSESAKSKQAAKKVDAGDSKVKTSKQSSKKDDEIDSDGKPLKQPGEKGEKSKVITKPSEDIANKDEGSDSEVTPQKVLSDDEDERTDSDDIPLKAAAKKGNKSVSSVAISAPKKKDAKKAGRDNNVQENDQAQSVSEDDGMNVSLKSALKTATKGEGKLEKSVLSSSNRKRPVGKAKVTGTKYDETLVGQKVKIWWPDDEMFYEGVVASFNAATKEHQILYLDEEQEILNLKTEKWEIIQEYSVYQEKAAEVEIESTDVVSETPKKKKAKIDSGPSAPQGKSKDSVKRAGGASASGKSKGAASKSAGKSKGEASKSAGKSKSEVKANTKSKPVNLKEGEKPKEDDVEMSEAITKSKGEASKSAGKSKGEAIANTKSKPVNLKEDDVEMSEAITEKKQEPPEKIVYKRGKKKTASKITENEEKSEAKATSDTKPISENVKESDDGERDDVKEAESVKEKLTVTPKTGSKSGKKRKKT